MNLRAVLVVLAVAIAGGAAAPRLAWSQSALDRAHDELARGYALRKEGKYAQALTLLLDSYRLEPLLKTLINVADCEEHLGKLASAWSHWGDARAQAATSGEAAIAEEARKRVEALEARAPQLTIRLAADAPPSTTVSWDGGPASLLGVPIRVDLGVHVVVVASPGRAPRRYDVELIEGERRVLDVAPTAPIGATTTPLPDSHPAATTGGSPLRTLGWVTIGVGAASVVAGTVFGIEAISRKSDARCPSNACGGGGDPDTLRAAVRAGNLSTAFFVVGGLLGAGGVTLLVLAPPSPSVDAGASSVRASLTVAANGLSLQGAW